ncbi:DUF4270 family protein [Cloacibacterium normanense]|uniref:DUF4270 family protein n=1 Tax=Cloacibacterium normanense TaxID=237258 RepID=UPI0035B39193
MKKYIFWIFIILGLLLSCDDSRNEYLAGEDWTQADARLKVIDTLTLKMSTIMMDSVVTSGQSKILLGRTKDKVFGEVSSSSFFQLNPSSVTITNKNSAVFDSIALYLTYDNYYYGDTLKTFKLSVYPIENRLKLRNTGSLYNTSVTKYSNNEIGTVSFLPRPSKENNFLKIDLDKNYGQGIFNLLKSGNVENLEYFLNFYKGLAIIPSNENEAFLSFGIGNTLELKDESITTVVRMYYHAKSENGTENTNYTIDFNVNTGLQYNKISHDFSNSELQNLTPENAIDSKNLGNKAFQFSALGVYTKIEAPYVKNLLDLYQNITILDAKMNIKPVYGTYDKKYYLPEKLHYYVADKTNSILSSFTSDNSQEVSITLSENNEFQDNSQYTFTITDYLKTTSVSASDVYGFNILLYPTNYKDQQVERIVIGDSKNTTNKSNIKLSLLGY